MKLKSMRMHSFLSYTLIKSLRLFCFSPTRKNYSMVAPLALYIVRQRSFKPNALM